VLQATNLSLYTISAFVALDTDGNRVLAKYYKHKNTPALIGDGKAFLTLKDQRAFEKGLWEKTKKPGGRTWMISSALLGVC
jgi:Na+-transporting NADH:ubiquinone oxidoreductase subunit NqrC